MIRKKRKPKERAYAAKEDPLLKKKIGSFLMFSIVVSGIIFLFTKNIVKSSIFFISFLILFFAYIIINKKLKESSRIKKMEDVFPDFLQLVSSNLRAGMTIDRSLMLSARKEFYPLDLEINALGKEIVTGTELNSALIRMGKRINSKKIEKTISLIITGIRSGGNLAVLLEQIASNMRNRAFIEKKAASNILMYVIFVFFAVAFGAPILFGLSSILVEVMSGLLSGMPVTNQNLNLPISFSGVDIPINFIIYYSVAFLIMTGILASLILGLVMKGKEKEGLKFTIPIIVINVSVFFLVRKALSGFLQGFFK